MVQHNGETTVKRAPFSYRTDPAVPHFPDDRPIIVFDGKCVLCSGFAQFVMHRDRDVKFRLLAAQSPLGDALYRYFELDPVNYETYILLQDGIAYFRSEAAIRILEGFSLCRGGWRRSAVSVPSPFAIAFMILSRATVWPGSALGQSATSPMPRRRIAFCHDNRIEDPGHRRLRHFRRPHRRAFGKRTAIDTVRRRPLRGEGKCIYRVADRRQNDPAARRVRPRRRCRHAIGVNRSRHRRRRLGPLPGLWRRSLSGDRGRDRASHPLSRSRRRLRFRARRRRLRREGTRRRRICPLRRLDLARAHRGRRQAPLAGPRAARPRCEAASRRRRMRASASMCCAPSRAMRAARSSSGATARPAKGSGLAETMRYTIAPPGRLPLESRVFSLVDVPDLRILPRLVAEPARRLDGHGRRHPPSCTAVFVALARLVRYGVLPGIAPLAPADAWRARHGSASGPHRGGMFVEVAGLRCRSGERVTRSWHMVAEGDDGPFIPSMAAAAIIRRCLAGRPPPPGAREASRELELSDYARPCSRNGRISSGIRQDGACEAHQPLYRRLLGPSLRRAAGSPARDARGRGAAFGRRGSPTSSAAKGVLARLACALFGLPPPGRDVPVRVSFEPKDGGEVWRRDFRRPCLRQSRQYRRHGPLRTACCASVSAPSVSIRARRRSERLTLVPRRWSLFGIPLPVALASHRRLRSRRGRPLQLPCRDRPPVDRADREL